ncbi:MAG: hypothetical protein WA843_04860 [Candidatus Saccharimonadales bacterium]
MQSAITKAVGFLSGQQATDGSFGGQAGTAIANFKPERRHLTPFTTSLITGCLRDVPGTTDLRQSATHFLLSQKNARWSWNYWQRGSDMAKSLPYPDDLDDTACALIALTSYDSKLIDGHVLANLAKLLIATEQQPGGPYRTWLVGEDQKNQWSDVDIAVNANVGRLLALNKVQVPGLTNYLDAAISKDSLVSPYYVGTIPILYFLSSWYRGKQVDALTKLVYEQISRAEEHNALMLALVITAGHHLNLPAARLRSAHRRLLDLRTDDHWPAEALYVDPQIKGIPYYAGSTALTTAFALEALNRHQAVTHRPVKKQPTNYSNTIVEQALIDSRRRLPANLRRGYQAAVRSTAERDTDQQITGMANLIANAYGKKVAPAALAHLNLASLNGWIAYTIYDDFFDYEGDARQLGVANVALRQTVRHFYAALPRRQSFHRLVDGTLDIVDAANTWEVRHARGTIIEHQLDYALPRYAAYHQLADRSWGHMLAASGVMLALGHEKSSQEFQQLQRFFRHFLIARQLNDDAHDWETDLTRGHLSAVVTLLLNDYGNHGLLRIDEELDLLRQHFWQKTIYQVAVLIHKHIRLSRQALRKCGMVDSDTFTLWLDALESATRSALNGSQETEKFIRSYQNA